MGHVQMNTSTYKQQTRPRSGLMDTFNHGEWGGFQPGNYSIEVGVKTHDGAPVERIQTFTSGESHGR